MRPPCIHHCTSEPYRFFGRAAELALLDAALRGGPESVAALIGPGEAMCRNISVAGWSIGSLAQSAQFSTRKSGTSL